MRVFSHFSLQKSLSSCLSQRLLISIILNIFADIWTFCAHLRADKLKLCQRMLLVDPLMGNTTCIFYRWRAYWRPICQHHNDCNYKFQGNACLWVWGHRVYYYLRSCNILLSAMHECPSHIISSIVSNTSSSRECIAVTLLSTYNGTRRAQS